MDCHAGLPRSPSRARRGAVGATRKTGWRGVAVSRTPHKRPSRRDGVLWADPATAGTGRFFQAAGQAPAATCHKAQRLAPKDAAWAGSNLLGLYVHVLWAELLHMEGAACR